MPSEPAYSVQPGTELNDLMRRFAQTLGEGLETPVVVASGKRSHNQQARILLAKIEKYGAEKALAVYPQKYRDSMTAASRQPQPIREMEAVSRRSGEPRGSHLRVEAIDVVITGLAEAGREALKARAERMGASVLLESYPVHFHVGSLHLWNGEKP